MFRLHRKKRIVLSTITALALVLPAIAFAANKFAVSEDTFAAVTYEMPEGYTTMVDPNFYDCAMKAFRSVYPVEEVPATGLTDEQLLRIDTLVCNDRQDGDRITDTTGIEKMSRMSYLDLSSNYISSIDLSGFNLLRHLNLHTNLISSINLDNNPGLQNLYLNKNQLTSINLSNNSILKDVDLSENQLTSINIANSPLIMSLKLDRNQLTSLNVSNMTNLSLLNINDNNLTALDVSNNASLNDLRADVITLYTGVEPTIVNGNYVYDLSGLGFLVDGNHQAYDVVFSIEDTDYYTYDKDNMRLTVNDPEGAGSYVEIDGVDDKDEGGFSYLLGLPSILNYDLNGGSGTFETQICYPGAETGNCTVEISDNTPTRTNYHFLGWATSASATTGTYQPGAEITLSESQTLYAIWAPIYTLSYNGNGASGAPAAQTCHANDTTSGCEVTVSSVVLVRDENHEFLGWADSATATLADYVADDVIVLTGNKTIYAAWGLVSTAVSLDFNTNGGEGQIDAQSCAIDIDHPTCNVTIPSTTPTRSGYYFLGWATSSSATTAAYQPSGTFTLNDNQTLYAIWAPIHTLNYNGNDGSSIPETSSCHANDTTSGCSVTIVNTEPTRNGYNFLGWADNSGATSAIYHGGGSLTLTDDKTIYAVWDLITTDVSLDFNLNGGAETVATQTCTIDINHPTCAVTIPNTTPTRNGYNFLGWADSSSATVAAYSAGSSVNINSNKTIYAVWELITTTVHLNFNLNGGAGTMAAQTCTTDINHSTCTATIPNTAPTRAGYNFLGWADSSSATEAAYSAGDSFDLSSDKTVYAVWDLVITTIGLSFDLNGVEGEIPMQTCEVDINHPTCSFVIPETELTREGYNYLGWAESATATEAVYQNGDTVTISANKTIYVVWEEIKSEDDEPDVPVPDTSAPDTGANTVSDTGAVFSLAVAPAVIAVVYKIVRRHNKKNSWGL